MPVQVKKKILSKQVYSCFKQETHNLDQPDNKKKLQKEIIPQTSPPENRELKAIVELH